MQQHLGALNRPGALYRRFAIFDRHHRLSDLQEARAALRWEEAVWVYDEEGGARLAYDGTPHYRRLSPPWVSMLVRLRQQTWTLLPTRHLPPQSHYYMRDLIRVFLHSATPQELEWAYGALLDQDVVAELQLRRALKLSPAALRSAYYDQPWEAELALRVEYARLAHRHRRSEGLWLDSLWHSRVREEYLDGAEEETPWLAPESRLDSRADYWSVLTADRWWPMHKTGVLAARALRFKRNQEMENYLRYQIGRVKIRLLDEEYYPGVFNMVEKLSIFILRGLVW